MFIASLRFSTNFSLPGTSSFFFSHGLTKNWLSFLQEQSQCSPHSWASPLHHAPKAGTPSLLRAISWHHLHACCPQYTRSLRSRDVSFLLTVPVWQLPIFTELMNSIHTSSMKCQTVSTHTARFQTHQHHFSALTCSCSFSLVSKHANNNS